MECGNQKITANQPPDPPDMFYAFEEEELRSALKKNEELQQQNRAVCLENEKLKSQVAECQLKIEHLMQKLLEVAESSGKEGEEGQSSKKRKIIFDKEEIEEGLQEISIKKSPHLTENALEWLTRVAPSLITRIYGIMELVEKRLEIKSCGSLGMGKTLSIKASMDEMITWINNCPFLRKEWYDKKTKESSTIKMKAFKSFPNPEGPLEYMQWVITDEKELKEFFASFKDLDLAVRRCYFVNETGTKKEVDAEKVHTFNKTNDTEGLSEFQEEKREEFDWSSDGDIVTEQMVIQLGHIERVIMKEKKEGEGPGKKKKPKKVVLRPQKYKNAAFTISYLAGVWPKSQMGILTFNFLYYCYRDGVPDGN
jgi:hypothetical protein